MFCICIQTNTDIAVASVLALIQNNAAVVNSTTITVAITILSQNRSALQNETVNI